MGTDTGKAEVFTASVSSALVLRKLENAILSGYFKPRERLVERDLLAHYDVSRTIIREVLKMLEGKGLVKITPYRGAVVVDLSAEEVEEIYFLRQKLEAIAARLVVENITRVEIQRLKKLCKELEKHLSKKTDQMIEKDNEFHRALFQASENSHLNEMIDHLSTKVHMVKFNAWSLPNRIEHSISEHRAMIAALERRDAEAFEKLVIEHLLFSKNSYMAQLKGIARRGIVKGRPHTN
ncbi:MAG: GntR family transcriptional regulator [Syntrophobacteraceae bacterium]|jgi:DNA-binding GntR family transcriptional regulator